jgi:hypothetical protein
MTVSRDREKDGGEWVRADLDLEDYYEDAHMMRKCCPIMFIFERGDTSDLREVRVYSDKYLYIPLLIRVLIIAEGVWADGKRGNGGRVVEVKDGWLRLIVCCGTDGRGRVI